MSRQSVHSLGSRTPRGVVSRGLAHVVCPTMAPVPASIDSVYSLDWDLDFDGPWSAAAVTRYANGGYNGLTLSGRRNPPKNLDFLSDLPGLRSLTVNAMVADDAAAFALPILENLVLATGSRRRVPSGTKQPRMRRLMLGVRPGIDVATYWPNVEWLRLPQAGEDCHWLGNCAQLRHLQLEGRRRVGTLEGVENCPNLQTLRSSNYPLCDVAPLSSLAQLQDVRLISRRPGPPHKRVDLCAFEQSSLRRLWLSTAQILNGLESLARHDRLVEVRILDHVWSSAERAAIADLPRPLQTALLGVT